LARARQTRPVTAQRVEDALDTLAWLMSRSKNAHLGVPLWKRLESELADLRDSEAIMAAARERFRRSLDRTEARSS
jgi:hypothetical protein